MIALLRTYWKPLAALLLVVSLCAGSAWLASSHTDGKWQTRWQARDLSDAQAEIAARKVATEKSNRLAAAQEQAAQAYEQGKQHAQNEADATIAAYRAGSIRLRAQFTCFNSSVSNTTTSTGISDAARDCGLSERDVSNLVRLSQRANEVAEQLKAAQDIIRADRAIINGEQQK